jgi:hypothetical protein
MWESIKAKIIKKPWAWVIEIILSGSGKGIFLWGYLAATTCATSFASGRLKLKPNSSAKPKGGKGNNNEYNY